MENKIKITISAGAGVGKSATAFAIQSFLRSKGLSCNILGCEDEFPGVLEKTWETRLNAISRKVEVEIETQQATKGSF